MATGQSDLGNSSVEILSSQMTLGYVKLTKKKKTTTQAGTMPAVVACTFFKPALKKLREMGFREFNATLVYTASSD